MQDKIKAFLCDSHSAARWHKAELCNIALKTEIPVGSLILSSGPNCSLCTERLLDLTCSSALTSTGMIATVAGIPPATR